MSDSPRGKLITVEGIEGAGKTTAMVCIQTCLSRAKVNFIVTREPGGTQIAEEIRQVLLFPASSEIMQPITELLLMFSARAQLISQKILPALLARQYVLSDRYVDASYAYQGGGRGIPMEYIKQLDKMIVQDIYPDITFLLDVSAEVGLQRAKSRGGKRDRIEKERIDFFERVRQSYLERAAASPERIIVIDAALPLTQVEAQIMRKMDKVLLEWAS